MRSTLLIFYAVAVAIHAAILFWLKPPAPKPPKVLNETYVDVALAAPPIIPASPKPVVISQPQKIEPPEPEEKSRPAPKLKPELIIPESKPISPSKPELPKPIVPPSQPKPPTTEYVHVSQPTFERQAQHIYPPQAARRHQQGTVTLMLYIGSDGALEKIEIVKSSGYPLLDQAAVREMRISKFQPAMDGIIPIRSCAQATVTYRLQ